MSQGGSPQVELLSSMRTLLAWFGMQVDWREADVFYTGYKAGAWYARARGDWITDVRGHVSPGVSFQGLR